MTANNHCSDAGRQGVIETIRLLDKYNISHTGTFLKENDNRFLLYDINGIKVAVLSYTELINNSWGYNSAEERNIMLNRWSEEKVIEDTEAARNAGAQFIIAYTHWGVEHTHTVTDTQKSHAQIMADAGIDLIIGSHSHCLQPAEIITRSNGEKTYCIYSMGNFVSSMAKEMHNDTIILKVNISNENGETVISDWGYIAAKVFASYEDKNHFIVPVSPELNGNIQTDALVSARNRIAEVMDLEIHEITSLE